MRGRIGQGLSCPGLVRGEGPEPALSLQVLVEDGGGRTRLPRHNDIPVARLAGAGRSKAKQARRRGTSRTSLGVSRNLALLPSDGDPGTPSQPKLKMDNTSKSLRPEYLPSPPHPIRTFALHLLGQRFELVAELLPTLCVCQAKSEHATGLRPPVKDRNPRLLPGMLIKPSSVSEDQIRYEV